MLPTEDTGWTEVEDHLPPVGVRVRGWGYDDPECDPVEFETEFLGTFDYPPVPGHPPIPEFKGGAVMAWRPMEAAHA